MELDDEVQGINKENEKKIMLKIHQTKPKTLKK